MNLLTIVMVKIENAKPINIENAIEHLLRSLGRGPQLAICVRFQRVEFLPQRGQFVGGVEHVLI